MIGLPIAVALGALTGRPEYQLEVLKDCDKDDVLRGQQFINENRIHIALEEKDPDKLFIRALCTADGHEAEAIIKGHHTHFVYIRKDHQVLLSKNDNQGQQEEDNEIPLTLRKVYVEIIS